MRSSICGRWLKYGVGSLILLSMTGCVHGSRIGICEEYPHPSNPPVHTRQGQDAETAKEITNLLIYWEVMCEVPD